jgi:hypothetical protein
MFIVTHKYYVEVPETGGFVPHDDFVDSLSSTFDDLQDSLQETSDQRWEYYPRETLSLQIESSHTRLRDDELSDAISKVLQAQAEGTLPHTDGADDDLHVALFQAVRRFLK